LYRLLHVLGIASSASVGVQCFVMTVQGLRLILPPRFLPAVRIFLPLTLQKAPLAKASFPRCDTYEASRFLEFGAFPSNQIK